ELLSALVHRKTHHTIESNRGENERDDSENREQRRNGAITGENLIVESPRRSGKISRQVRIELSNRFTQSWAKSISPLTGARTNKDGTKLRSRRCAQQWHVKSHAF